MIDVKINGLAELQQRLDQVAPKVERNVLRGGLRAGMRVVLPEARRNIRSVSGKLAAGLRVGSGGRGGRVFSYLRARGPHAYIAPWLEFGTKAHRIDAKGGGWLSLGGVFRRGVWHKGIAPFGNKSGTGPKSFMRPALAAKAAGAVIAAAEYMRDRLASKEGLDTADLTFDVEEG